MYHFKFTNIKLIFFFKSRNKNVCFIFILLLILENCCCLGRLQHAWVHAALKLLLLLWRDNKKRDKKSELRSMPPSVEGLAPFVRCSSHSHSHTQLVTTVGLLYLSLAASKDQQLQCLGIWKCFDSSKNLSFFIRNKGFRHNPPKLDAYLKLSRFPWGVWKSQEKSHSTLRAKRATFTFWMDES